MDEKDGKDRLNFILPSHELFHQSMVVADCESKLFRDSSRGLEGGAFFQATILHRKEAKLGKGKDSIDALKDMILLKADARFCQCYIKKKNLDPNIDNTPPLIKSASPQRKQSYLHQEVANVLRDLLPEFKHCRLEDPMLQDHPLQEGRRAKYKAAPESDILSSDLPSDIEFSDKNTNSPMGDCLDPRSKSGEDHSDMYWNYKNGEFFMDAIFAITDHFISYGDGLGCFIVNKVLLPIFHGLKHSNYSNSVHRFITRVLCEATPKEGLKLVHEKFREVFEI